MIAMEANHSEDVSPADMLESFSILPDPVDHRQLEIVLQPPDINDTKAVEIYQARFRKLFGYAPTPLSADSYEWKGEGEQPQLWAFTDGRDLAITSDPFTSSLLAELGPAGFDVLLSQNNGHRSLVSGVINLDEPGTLQSSRDDKLSFSLQRVSLSSDGLFTVKNLSSTAMELGTEHLPAPIHFPGSHETGDPLSVRFMSWDIVPDLKRSFALAEKITNPELKKEFEDYLHDIGIARLDDGSFTMPTPVSFQARLAARRAEGKYAPTYAPIGRRTINSGLFNYAFEHGVIPHSTLSLRLFLHDIASDHTLAYLKYGDPLINLVSAYAQLEPEPDFVSGSGLLSIDEADWTTSLIDTLTAGIALEEVKDESPNINTVLNEIARRLNQSDLPNLRHIEVIDSAFQNDTLHRGMKANGRPGRWQISGNALLIELNRLARIPSANPVHNAA